MLGEGEAAMTEDVGVAVAVAGEEPLVDGVEERLGGLLAVGVTELMLEIVGDLLLLEDWLDAEEGERLVEEEGEPLVVEVVN